MQKINDMEILTACLEAASRWTKENPGKGVSSHWTSCPVCNNEKKWFRFKKCKWCNDTGGFVTVEEKTAE